MKVSIIILADTDRYEGLARVVNALEAAKEFIEAGDEVQIIFDGAAAKWPIELSKANHPYHGLYEAVKECVAGVCGYCANAFQVREANEACGLSFIEEYEGHPSFRNRLLNGYHILTF